MADLDETPNPFPYQIRAGNLTVSSPLPYVHLHTSPLPSDNI